MIQKTQNKFFILALSLLTAALIYLLSPILTPFLAAALLAYLVDPLVKKLSNKKIPRVLSVSLVFLLISASIAFLILLLTPYIAEQINALIDTIPNIVTWVQTNILPWFKRNLGFRELSNGSALKTVLSENVAKAGGATSWLVTTTVTSGLTIIQWGMNLVLIPVVMFYFLCDWDHLLAYFRNLLPRNIRPIVIDLFRECDEVLSAFLRGQLLVMLCLGTIYSIGLTIIGLQTGLLIGLIAGLLNIVPYLGFIVGIVLASLAALIQFGDFYSVVLVWAVFTIGNTIDGMFLTPKLVGNRLGLHPVVVIFALLAGGSLFGFLGVLLALPVAAMIVACMRYFYKRYQSAA